VQGGTIAANLSGGMQLVKSSIDTAVLSGVNNYTGGTAVNTGTLIVATATALPDGGALTVGAGGAFVSGTQASSDPTVATAISAPAVITPARNAVATSACLIASDTPIVSAAVAQFTPVADAVAPPVTLLETLASALPFLTTVVSASTSSSAQSLVQTRFLLPAQHGVANHQKAYNAALQSVVAERVCSDASVLWELVDLLARENKRSFANLALQAIDELLLEYLPDP